MVNEALFFGARSGQGCAASVLPLVSPKFAAVRAEKTRATLRGTRAHTEGPEECGSKPGVLPSDLQKMKLM